jgi:hypothetical protein
MGGHFLRESGAAGEFSDEFRSTQKMARRPAILIVSDYTTDGRHFDIHSQSMLWPGKYSAMIGVPENPNEPDVPAKHIRLTMLHFVSVEPTPTNSAV